MGVESIPIAKPPIFLSASIPTADRAAKYWTPETFPRITAAIRGLLVAALPRWPVVFGGHPAITPMVWRIVDSLGPEAKSHVLLYQSLFFQQSFVPEVTKFAGNGPLEVVLANNASDLKKYGRARVGQLVLIVSCETKEKSLTTLRTAMLEPKAGERATWRTDKKDYDAAVFVGGMEGIEEEYDLFRKFYPKLPVFPVISTGGASASLGNAAKKLVEKDILKRLQEDVCYEVMFKDLLRLWR